MPKDELIEALEKATGPDRELDERIGLAIGLKNTMRVGHECLGTDRIVPVRCPAYTASIDAALTLVPEGWLTRLVSFAKGNEPKPVYWRCNFRTWTRDEQGDVQTRSVVGVAPTPALAICIAALRATERGEAGR